MPSVLRQLLVLLFIVANLTAHVSLAYACTMAEGAPKTMQDCCCSDPEVRASCGHATAGKDCCQIVVEVSPVPGNQVAQVQPDFKLPNLSQQLLSPALLATALSLVPDPAPTRVFREAQRDPASPGTTLYLHTQRLRL